MTKHLFTVLAAAAAIASPASAEPAPAETVRIAIADLDLGSSAGRDALEVRLSRAARDLCGAAADVDLAGRNAVRECRAQAVAEGHRQLDQRLARSSTAAIQLAARAD